MSQPIDPDALHATARAVLAEMQQFNVTHPTATLTEIEDAVEAALAGLRQDLLTQSVQGQPLADFRGATERPVCPDCGGTLQANGQHARQVVTQGDRVLRIDRTRGRCVVCGTTFFPPG